MTRTTLAERQKLALHMRDQYDAGATIRSVARRAGVSYSTARSRLLGVGTVLRPRGGRKRVKQPAA